MAEDGIAEETYERLKLCFEALGGGLWDYDIIADSLLCNRRWYRIVGVDPAARTIRSIADFRSSIHPDDVQLATTIDLTNVPQLLDEDGHYHVEFRIIRPDGAVRWLRSVACLIDHARTGVPHRAVGCITDITEFRAAGAPAEPAPEPNERMLPEAGAPIAALTPKEKECLMWVAVGKTAWETAGILGISSRTVEFHLHNAITKLDASNKIHAAAIAIRNGLI